MSVDEMSEDEISSYVKSVDFITIDAIKIFLFVVQRPVPFISCCFGQFFASNQNFSLVWSFFILNLAIFSMSQ